ncbi:MAG: rod shape-determining protein MreC [bacterium]|nr:rod shape-determining protein MreC [bacterium]
MLWRLRKELIFLFFLILSYYIKKNSLNSSSYISSFNPDTKNVINYEEIINENKRLREILNLKEKRILTNFKVAEIAGLNPPIFPAEIFIDKGKKDGLSDNDIVVTKNIFLIGKIEKVYDSYSKIISLFHKKTKISVIVASTKEIGIVEGGYGPFLLLKYIPYDSKVKIGDEIFTSGFSEYYYSGLKIGKVIKIIKIPNSLFLKIYIKPYMLTDNFKEVIIVK